MCRFVFQAMNQLADVSSIIIEPHCEASGNSFTVIVVDGERVSKL